MQLPKASHAKQAISRYTKLRESLDSDMFNQNWVETDTRPAGLQNRKVSFRFIDVFSGGGGLSLGTTQAGFKKVLSVEIDPDASDTMRKNFPYSTHIDKPIEEVTAEEIRQIAGAEPIHLLCGGPPCNGFSVAGARRVDDPRNQLFREFVRFVEITKPWVVAMENVPGILTMQKGAVKDAILEEFARIGYPDMSVRILEAAEFEVPQLRTRAIFIANRFGLPNEYPAQIIKNREDFLPIESAISDLIDVDRDPATNHEWTAHRKEYEERLSKVPPGGSLYATYRDAFKRQYLGVPSMAIKENHGGTHIHPILNRVISAREMARLQSFPDSYIFSGRMKRVMWQVGNAVPVLLAKHIALAAKSMALKIDQQESKTRKAG